MVNNNNILLITDNDDVAKFVTETLVLLRDNDKIKICDSKSIKKAVDNSPHKIIILHESDDEKTTLKNILQIKSLKNDSELILLLNYINPRLIIDAYDSGISDYFSMDSDDYEILIKTVNCFKHQLNKDIQLRNEKFLRQLGVIDNKTGLYRNKYLKDIFIDISDDLRIQNGIFAILTLDSKIKTKVSTNRLALTLKSGVRGDDIIAVGRGGNFYMILPNIDLLGTRNLINKIQERMGADFPIHSGLSKIGIKSYETIEKNASDGLISAIQNNELTVCLEDNVNIQKTWLDDDEDITQNKKNFKLFKVVFSNKMSDVITPIFFRFQKDYETKLVNTDVSQYSNNIESVFCLKNEDLMSELVIRYNGYAKFNIEINHSGLESVENFDEEIPLSQMTEKYLSGMLKRLKDEYKESLKLIKQTKEEEDA